MVSADVFPRVTVEETPDGLIARETLDSAVARVARTYATTEDDAIRRQLVALGWTPPGTAVQPAPSATREEMAEALGVVWDDGNGTGLDGWVGPGRGAGEVDHEAVRARDRAVDRALRVIAAAPSATRDEVAHTITLTPIDVDLEALAAYSEGVTDEMVLRVRRNPDPKEDR